MRKEEIKAGVKFTVGSSNKIYTIYSSRIARGCLRIYEGQIYVASINSVSDTNMNIVHLIIDTYTKSKIPLEKLKLVP